ncbi:MAG: Gfo/Idh/MocA family oxidoreductase [Oscillospiraceae bacterium]|jgi:predicted dehydrogenase|nr:Gfo/Idh/MocA family oxidoreductase [Oscillospiraceae bacterium]
METLKVIRLGCVGLGGRGQSQMREMMSVPGVTVAACCDKHLDRAEAAAKSAAALQEEPPAVYTNYKELLARTDIDAILCCSTWITHARIAIDSMRAGKDVAIEVGGAASVEECWRMVRASEETGKVCMLLENCCYDRKEMALFRMVREGLFGEIVHLEGGYRHDLREEICYGRENRHGRLPNFIARNGELYPTHQLGPIAKMIGINRGNRFLTLCSLASKSRGLRVFVQKREGAEYHLANTRFNCGDVVSTTITCANGETIHLTHDCSLPRPYSRAYMIEGTNGIFQEAPFGNAIYLEDNSPPDTGWDHTWERFEDTYLPRYEHPLWDRYRAQGIHAGGHGGMDFLVCSAFIRALQTGTPPPIDVYDTAAWMVITCLSEQSVAMGGAPVPIPDFTNGAWIEREPFARTAFCLEDICEECFCN